MVEAFHQGHRERLRARFLAEGLDAFEHIHGRKGPALVHVGAVDAPVTIRQVNEAVAEAATLDRKELHVLGWEWEMGLHDPLAQQVMGEHDIKTTLQLAAGYLAALPKAVALIKDNINPKILFFLVWFSYKNLRPKQTDTCFVTQQAVGNQTLQRLKPRVGNLRTPTPRRSTCAAGARKSGGKLDRTGAISRFPSKLSIRSAVKAPPGNSASCLNGSKGNGDSMFPECPRYSYTHNSRLNGITGRSGMDGVRPQRIQ